MERITSVKNETIKRLRTLKTKKGRIEQGLFLVEGGKSVKEALRWADVAYILTTEPQDWENQGNVLWVTPEILEAVAATKTPQKVLAAVRTPQQKEIPVHGMLVALDDVQDPQNVGTIIRTADCVGAQAVLVSPETADYLSPKSVRAAMGSVFRIPVIVCTLETELKKMRQRGYTVIAGDLNGKDEGKGQEDACVVIGNEARGISEQILAQADRRYKIAIYGEAESLNAAVAAGILLYRVKEGF